MGHLVFPCILSSAAVRRLAAEARAAAPQRRGRRCWPAFLAPLADLCINERGSDAEEDYEDDSDDSEVCARGGVHSAAQVLQRALKVGLGTHSPYPLERPTHMSRGRGEQGGAELRAEMLDLRAAVDRVAGRLDSVDCLASRMDSVEAALRALPPPSQQAVGAGSGGAAGGGDDTPSHGGTSRSLERVRRQASRPCSLAGSM